jgi:predicted nucleic acid-binding Zn ribbon protein
MFRRSYDCRFSTKYLINPFDYLCWYRKVEEMIYDYKCDTCKSELTIERSIHAEANAPICFDCHTPMDRVYGVGGIKFNAPGFYSTGG